MSAEPPLGNDEIARRLRYLAREYGGRNNVYDAAADRIEALVALLAHPGDEVYDAAVEAVNKIAEGVPAWVITVAVNAALSRVIQEANR